ncbi:pyridoxal phosphate-dependent aminotransferase [Cecembia rubra]|uniref:Aminotransferase n=1 Tax=Cecembia rubra TaxID=1485585 RepID=A0A2P8EA71_9BACT|nr:aminotransferase class I/II-fold pyridoxal phosphate-dependent enzyme [Cecembia rubra]PSL06372.1 aspartate/methionine/tyrosine aminotransferase [Cecembia rubra]
MTSFSDRSNNIQEYYFSQKLKEVKRMQLEGKPVINMGIGSPDLSPAPSVIKALNDCSVLPDAHGYQSYQGIPELRQAFLKFYANYYQVKDLGIDEVLPLLGSKEGILHISMAFTNPGDSVLLPDPGYPTYTSVSKMLDLTCVPYSLREENGWYPDFEQLELLDLEKVKLMWVNYPHMPTGAKADFSVFQKLVEFAEKHQILLVHDNPYSFILQEKPMSIFQVEGAKEVALELNSLSKTANMAGWRIGAVFGKREFIEVVTRVKSNVDSGMFLGLQRGAIAALELDESWFNALNSEYAQRRVLVWDLAEKLGLSFQKDTSGMFVWAKLNEGRDSKIFVDDLLYKKNLFVTPGDIFGQNGAGWVRFSLCVSQEKIKEAINRI